MKKIKSIKLMSVLLLLFLSSFSNAIVITQIVGDDDAFGGTQGGLSVDGAAFTNLIVPLITPGSYFNEDGLDAGTIEPWSPYNFGFTFDIDTSNFLSISGATINVVSGSVARRDDGTGYGFANVAASFGGNNLDLGSLLSTVTGAPASAIEETIKFHIFDVMPLLNTNMLDTLSFTIDGSTLNNPTDQFAIDYVMLSIQGELKPINANAPAFGFTLFVGVLFFVALKKVKRVNFLQN